MATLLNAYLNFKNTSREAMEFYHSILGGNLIVTSFKDGGMSHGPETDNLTMHSQLTTDFGTLMASDTPPEMEYKPGTNFGLSLSGDNEEELRGFWSKLSEGGTITMPIDKAPWGDIFGMFTDKFGVNWMVNIAGKHETA